MSTSPLILPILEDYRALLAEADAWFSRCLDFAGTRMRCGQGCAGCCRSLFDITLLDAFLLRSALDRLPRGVQKGVLAKARLTAGGLERRWPGFAPPYLLNTLPEEEWTDIPEEDETLCPLLSPEGGCLLYDDRPLTCRLHGLPHVDFSGEVFEEEGCTLNFPGENPLALPELHGAFRELFAREARLIREFSAALLGSPRGEIDTFIPLALLIDIAGTDWRSLRLK